jgi:RecA/RadA recombinase
MMSSRRQRKLDFVVSGLQLQYGPRAIRRAAGQHAAPVPCIATTFVELDAALAPYEAKERENGGAEKQPRKLPAGNRGGGLPRGRISEIIGPATSGKVTLAAKVLAAAQQDREALVAWLDLGRTCDPDYLHRCGLDLDRLLIVHPQDGADAVTIALHLVESNTLAVLVFDGLADLLGEMPMKSQASESSLPWTGVQPGQDGQAVASPGAENRPKPPIRDVGWRFSGQESLSLVTGMLERLSAIVAGTQTVALFLTEPYAQSRTLAHVATVRLAIRRERWVTSSPNGDVRGYEGTVEILKHKLGQAGAIVPIRITFNGTVRGDGL